MMKDAKFLSRDRMRFNANKTSALLTYAAIVFNVLYFVDVYSSNFDYYYTTTMGLSVIYNLLFLLCAFLCSEGVKKYSIGYSSALIAIGAMQIVRIFYLPMGAHKAFTEIGEQVMDDKQFITVIVYLSLSAICAIAGGVIGVERTITLNNHKKELEKNN